MRNRCRRFECFRVPARVVLAALLSAAGTARCLAAEEAKPQPAANTGEVQVVRDLVYRELAEGEDAAKGKNKLDLYLPKGRKDFPVVFFVHGGAWRNGDKNGILGVYGNLGRV